MRSGSDNFAKRRDPVGGPSKLEMAILEVLWTHGAAPVREILAHFPRKSRPSHNTILTLMGRMKGKGLVAVAGKTGNANVYQAAISRDAVQRGLMDEMLGLFAGQAAPLMSHLIDAGKLTLKDVEEAERRLRARLRKPGKG
jgi:BlaI family penicillinase repressor